MTALETLLAAKAESDRKNYAAKHALVRKLIQQQPDQFAIDSDDGTGFLGLTHVPTGFKMHMPAGAIPVPVEKSALDELAWGAFPHEVERLTKLAAPFAVSLPRDGRFLWFDPEAGEAHHETTLPPGFGDRPWMPIKTAAEGAFRPLFSAMQMVPNKFNETFGGPTPLAAMSAGGVLGAGLGYGSGWLIEKLLGRKVLEPGRLRTLGALTGGTVGALPGLYLGSVGARLNAEDGKPAANAFAEPNVLFGKEGSEGWFNKNAEEAGGLIMPMIPVDAFNRTVWADPNTPIPLRAAATGLVTGAAQVRGGAEWVSPLDVGRIAVGMGSGLVSGLLVGKALGALAGLNPAAQNVLKQTGMWAGALRNVIPKAFGF